MLVKPTLQVNRLIVFQGGHTALDLVFHKGVNVIRGRNSSGKTTTMDLLAFSLGAENIRWKPEALLCTDTFVEVQLNGKAATFRREISAELKRPMSIFWGNLNAALTAGPHQWEHYPFLRSIHRISFSQAILQALEMPQAQSDGASNLTLHQLLRVLYADQPSVHSPIFRLDSYDKPLIRETVGAYLCGVYDDELYSAQLRVREVSAIIAKAESELKSIFSVLGRSGQNAGLDYLSAQIIDLESARNAQSEELIRLKNQRNVPKAASKSNVPDELRKKLNQARQAEANAKDRLQSLELDLADSSMFVSELKARLKNLEESKETRSFFGNLRFQFCPSCLTPIGSDRDNVHNCHLCVQPHGDERGETQILRMRNEINIQLKESLSLIEKRQLDIDELRRTIPLLSLALKELEKQYNSTVLVWSSEVESAIEDAARKLGKFDEEIRQAYEKQKLSSIIAELQSKRDELRNEESSLNDRIRQLEARQESRLASTTKSVTEKMKQLLQLDLPLQEEFKNPRDIVFDFVENSVYVNGAKNFSESSAVVLRHVFHLALLSASVANQHMRVPHFLMLDGIDDGGMEKARSHRLQEIIVGEAENYPIDFQLIFATSEINPKFEDSELVVGRYFTPEARSLDVRI